MPVFPKSFFVVGASIRTALAGRRLKQRHTAAGAQQQALRALLPEIARTTVGRDAGVEAAMDYAKFRARVPLRRYEHIAPAIERMARGEADVLWPGVCSRYLKFSVNGEAAPRTLPLTDPMLAHFRHAALSAMLCYTARVGHAGVMRGRHVFLGGSSEWIPLATGSNALSSGLAGVLEIALPAWAERYWYEPGAALAHDVESPAKLAAIAARARPLDITLIAGEPDALLGFAAAASRGEEARAPAANLKAVWPNLECLVHSGTMLGSHSEDLRRAAGPGVNLHEVHAAAEGLIAAQAGESAAGLRLLADAGLFFEFLPLADYDESLPAALGARALPVEEVRPGENYVLVLTTPAGLCRYVSGTIVRFTSTQPARLVWAGRTRLQLNAFGEHVVERDLAEVLTLVCQRHGWSITQFHVAPRFVASRTGPGRGGQEWWVELRPGTVETPTGPLLADEIDRELSRQHPGYGARRRSGSMEPPVVRLVMPGFFSHWIKHHAPALNHAQLSRCRSDRLIADNLMALACFTPD
jgi:hypothetical protein